MRIALALDAVTSAHCRPIVRLVSYVTANSMSDWRLLTCVRSVFTRVKSRRCHIHAFLPRSRPSFTRENHDAVTSTHFLSFACLDSRIVANSTSDQGSLTCVHTAVHSRETRRCHIHALPPRFCLVFTREKPRRCHIHALSLHHRRVAVVECEISALAVVPTSLTIVNCVDNKSETLSHSCSVAARLLSFHPRDV